MTTKQVNIQVLQMPAFKRAYKKLSPAVKEKTKKAVQAIIDNPLIGQEKKGDLKEVFVYKFKAHTQQYLLAYRWEPRKRLLLALGVHENFYRDLKH